MVKAASVSIVLPAHNEAPNIRKTVSDCLAAFSERFADVELIVADDGSTDETAAIVAEMAASESRIKLERHGVNKGYGSALRTGFAAATKEWIFFTDSDGQFDPASIAEFMPRMDDADIVAGFRIKRMDNAYRRMLGTLYTFLTDVFFGVGVKDVNCAFKLMRRSVVMGLDLTSEGALINAELLSLARRRGARIVQVGVPHYPRLAGEQSGGSSRVIKKALMEYYDLYSRLRSIK